MDKRALEQFVCPAEEAVLLKLVSKEEDLSEQNIDNDCRHPEFTHQIFGESEKIFGYTNPQVKLFFTAGSMQTYLAMSYDKKAPDAKGVTADNPVAQVKEWLAPGWTSSLDEFRKRLADESKFTPPGELVKQYKTEDNSRTFEIYMNDTQSPGFADYLARFQIFLVWYIEAASYLDLEDERWRVFLLFERVEQQGQSHFKSVGLLSACEYWAYPDNLRPRVSQMLVLPWFQSQGHGAQLLQALYDYYLPQKKVIDFPVEDPAEQFTRLRDFVDCRNCLRIPEIRDFDQPFGSSFVKLVQSHLKLARTQIRRVYEILQLRRVSANKASPEYKAFMLRVKQRLYQPFAKSKDAARRELNKLEGEEKTVYLLQQKMFKEQLQEEFTRLLEEYQHVLDRIAVYDH